MLIEFSVANYRSFKEKVTFSMVAANLTAKDKQLDENNVYRVDKDLELLKSKLIEETKKLSNEDDYDQVWCVFDRDDWPKEDFNNAIVKAEKEGFRVAYSNEAFELWYVLHFEFLNTGIPRKDYIHKLDKLLGHKYQKNSQEIYDEIKSRQAKAIKNAENLLNQYLPTKPGYDNPSTTVHLLVKELNRFIS